MTICSKALTDLPDVRDDHTPTVNFEIPSTKAVNMRPVALVIMQGLVSLIVYTIRTAQHPMRMDLYWASSLPKLWACLEVAHLSWPLDFEWVLRPQLKRLLYFDKMDRAWVPDRGFTRFRRAAFIALSSSLTLIALWVAVGFVKLYVSNLAEAFDSLKHLLYWEVSLFGPLNPWAVFEEE